MKRGIFKEKGITLVALVVTIIILLILAGVTISLVVGQGGLIQRAKNSGDIYKEAEANESEELDEYGQVIDDAMKESGAITIDSLKNTDRTIDDLNADNGDSNEDGVVDTNDDLRGFYINLNGDGQITTYDDGVIFGDLKTGGKGVYWCRTTEGMYDDIDSVLDAKKNMAESYKTVLKEQYNGGNEKTKENIGLEYGIKSDCVKVSSYRIPKCKNLSKYEILKNSDGSMRTYEGQFGTKGIVKKKLDSKGNNRFYVMALKNIGADFTWYSNAEKKMNDFATYTSTSFGSGKENTKKMIARGNNNGKDPYDSNNTADYGILSDVDIWNIKPIFTKNSYIESSIHSLKFEPLKQEYEYKLLDRLVVSEPIPSILIDEGWFVPSRDEWNAFGAFFKIGGEGSLEGFDRNKYTYTDYYDYRFYKLSALYCSSSQSGIDTAWRSDFYDGNVYDDGLNRIFSARLAVTF